MGWELDEACMRAMGWEYHPRFPGDTTGYWRSLDGEQVISEERPHFSEDPSAARLLEDEIERQGLQNEYLTALRAFLPKRQMYRALCWDFMRTTPEQRARAFIATIPARSTRSQ